jgi:hypothetical protein
VDALWESVKVHADTLSAGEIVAVVAASTLTALVALCVCWRTRNTIRRLESELVAAREVSRRASWRLDAARHARGAKSHNEGASLVMTGMELDRADDPLSASYLDTCAGMQKSP